MGGPLILAIHEDTNANAAVLQGTEILAAVAEERLSRTRFQSGFPSLAVEEVLRLAGVTADDLDGVVAGNEHHFLPRLLGPVPVEGDHDTFGALHKGWLQLQSTVFSRRTPLTRAIRGFNSRALARRFGAVVPLVDHHTAHAYSAYLTSGFDEALAVSVDNMGDGYAAKVFRCREGRCDLLWGSRAVNSPGQFYGEITQALGFQLLDAGKVTGLAARGDPRTLYPVMERLFGLQRDDTDFRLAPLWTKARRRGVFRDLAAARREDVAAAAQRRLEDVVVAYVRRALRETGDHHLVLAGGVFANVLLNHRLWGLEEVQGLFVHPAMTDQGIAVGAGLAHAAGSGGARPHPIDHVFLGTDVGEEEIGGLLERHRIRAPRCDDVEDQVADRVVRGQIVARVTGRMEYGPRALGHRSVLALTRDPAVNQRINRRLDRSEFMPFAPATLAEHASECYRDYGAGVAHTARFMTLTLRCTDAMAQAAPAVVHVDGTARPQVVHEEFTPGLHRILKLVHERTGTPSVVNTSFNTHGEPIARTAEDALRLYREGRVDALALGPYLLED